LKSRFWLSNFFRKRLQKALTIKTLDFVECFYSVDVSGFMVFKETFLHFYIFLQAKNKKRKPPLAKAAEDGFISQKAIFWEGRF
jgi:hypothetical protein